MECLHPYCPMGGGLPGWEDVLTDPRLKVRPRERAALLKQLASFGTPGSAPPGAGLTTNSAALSRRLFALSPCLYADMDVGYPAEAVIHFCELPLASRIDCSNVHTAFLIQHPKKGPLFRIRPRGNNGPTAGDVSEALCSEVLAAAGIPRMTLDTGGWPVWEMPGHISLNHGRMRELKAYGDILVPCAPTNLIISIKTEAARERLLYSSNVVESIGFGFFSEPAEFWTKMRMRLYKRMGFSAIYMPQETLAEVHAFVSNHGLDDAAVNINGTPLYRSLADFGTDIGSVVGRSILSL